MNLSQACLDYFLIDDQLMKFLKVSITTIDDSNFEKDKPFYSDTSMIKIFWTLAILSTDHATKYFETPSLKTHPLQMDS